MAAAFWTRRRLATTVLTSAVALPFTRASWGRMSAASSSSERWIELVNTHTGEVVSVTFADASGLIQAALVRLQYVLRDHRVNEQHPIDTVLYLQLSDLAHAAGQQPRYEVISGYRSPVTNAQLRVRGHGVAEHSLHMEGRAIDVRLKGCKCSTLRDLALKAGRGGVGFYPRSDFVHLDTGRVRFWQG
jgi:uncharacterized protein YcbK (DUF882 family)